MKKLLLLLLLSLGFMGSANADAICKDGWKSTSEGSGTCSHHLGVCEWKPNYTYNAYSNDYNPSHNHGYDQCLSGGGGGGGLSDTEIIAAGIVGLIFIDALEVRSINLNQYKSTHVWNRSVFTNFLASVNKYYSYIDRNDIFDTIDVNSDERITVKEARAADKNRNGILTTTELEWFRKKYFKGTVF